ncbi:FecR family protein [Aestuariivivens sediminis]|uniref:FecR family protein n=1 Tax=Aestuariivivens sediminis TaxID=2913557 RepID=UPI001F591B91|nr:FecR domain-containing protein [Aestuariivivens sediminis]
MQKIIIKYLVDTLTDAQTEKLTEWLKDSKNQRKFKKMVKENYAINLASYKINEEAALLKVRKIIEDRNKPVRKLFRYIAAASVLLFVVLTVVLNHKGSLDQQTESPVIVNTKIVPGTNKATLTLEDGSQVPLEKGASFQTSNASSNGEQIVYWRKRINTITKEIEYNYLTIPRGGQFYVVLSDGTKVWLNSESQLKYPVAFNDGEIRTVELVYGEAYFDVSPSTLHKGSKFKVLHKAQEVEVLGTEFNIKAYQDEKNVYTTLVEGKVAVSASNMKHVLSPNQQTNLDLDSNAMTLTKVSVYDNISWKDGIFSFQSKPLQDIMKVLSRWYDVDVVFENKALEDITFTGVLGKHQNIDKILSTIKALSIIKNYEVNDQTITLN